MIMMMKRKDIVEFTGLCYTTIYNLEKQGQFPARRQLSPGRVAWLRSEVAAWVNSRTSLTSEPEAEFETLICTNCTNPCPMDHVAVGSSGYIPESCMMYAA